MMTGTFRVAGSALEAREHLLAAQPRHLEVEEDRRGRARAREPIPARRRGLDDREAGLRQELAEQVPRRRRRRR